MPSVWNGLGFVCWFGIVKQWVAIVAFGLFVGLVLFAGFGLFVGWSPPSHVAMALDREMIPSKGK